MFNKIFRAHAASNSSKRRQAPHRDRSSSSLSYEKLQSRLVLAGIFFDAATGTVTISGGAGNDAGRFFQLDATTYRATLVGVGSENFNISDVNEFVFIGFGGDDFVNNLTEVNSQLLGGSGADTLRGGDGDDFINGGAGNNSLFGEGGDDRIIGLQGDDTILGDDGNDRIFAGNGSNRILGGAGDDLIFGGTGVDRINGEGGIDQIFGLAGDDVLHSGDGGVAGSLGTTQADLILGHDGNDRILGAGGLNVFYGGNGDDVFRGGAGENRLHGQAGDDTLTGGSTADFIAGHAGNDTVSGLGGNDFILVDAGNDAVDGGAGTDLLVYRFDTSEYAARGSGTSATLDHSVDGMDTIDNVETLRFSDATRRVFSQAPTMVTVRPIVVSNNNGSNSAEFFGNASQEAAIMREVDAIFAGSNIDIQWQATRNWRNTFANVGDGPTRPSSDLTTIVREGDVAGVGSPNPLVIDMYFVEVSAGFGNTNEFTANGVAYVGANGITMHTGDNLPPLAQGRALVARVAAHEIAHNLGLRHVDDGPNLMNDGRELTLSQIWTMQDSQFTNGVTRSPEQVVLPQTTASSTDINSVQIDSTAGGCGGCGICGPCTGSLT